MKFIVFLFIGSIKFGEISLNGWRTKSLSLNLGWGISKLSLEKIKLLKKIMSISIILGSFLTEERILPNLLSITFISFKSSKWSLRYSILTTRFRKLSCFIDTLNGSVSIIDEVAFIRFDSVYRRFEDITEFSEEVEKLTSD